ncbi:pilus assembly protein TadG-related protein [Streptomyces sp. NPDC059680]|uniref:pilus assembly protein TadG-related protein n=1 Tax=Streptomyces TaxID=1883 RepID=UPI001E3CC71C|nr:pilus assembly protein TadG-related protein [Streptomyces barringtoniae]MCC5480673.1 pilus assembly protein TadG-related protein [Streptomyces barringtoniae]
MPPRRDAGQAFPIYITVVAGLLFLALAYLAVGQASVNRSGAQTAADAAALAAAQSERDQLAAQWVKVLPDPAKWQAVFEGRATIVGPGPCLRAGQLATQNHAVLNGCSPQGLLKYRVDVQTDKSVGRSVVPGSENYQSTASATAEITSLCTFEPPAGGTGGDALPPLTCNGKVWHLKPDDTTGLPKPEDLFDVHLAD